MRFLLFTVLCLLLRVPLIAQQVSEQEQTQAPDTAATVWQFGLGVYYYLLPEENNTASLIGNADYKSFHIEGRYNYEDERTAALFGGYRVETGHSFIVGATPMLGVVFGNTNGIAPGLLLDLSWKIFDFYSESEYVIDFSGSENNFFYTWTEIAVTPVSTLRTGISADRTRLYQSDLELQKGIFAEYTFWKLTAGVHYFNPFSSEDFVIATLQMEF